MKEHRSGEWSPELTEAEQKTLFKLANDSIDWGLNESEGRFDFSVYDLTDKLKVEAATFVTLNSGGALRGCIGNLEPIDPLYISVHYNALNAAFRDYRFDPIEQEERAGIEVHISILSPIEVIHDLDDFRIGEHGIILQKARARAVYLPEVAVDQGWNVEQTLTSLCQKAGLPDDAWKDGAEFSVFSSVVLSH